MEEVVGFRPVAVSEKLIAFSRNLSSGSFEEGDSETPPLYGFIRPANTIGRVKSFHGHFGVLVRALTYILMNGAEGLRSVSEYAVLNANYLMALLKNSYTLPYDRPACTNLCLRVFGTINQHSRSGYRQTFDGLWIPSADELFPTNRQRSFDDRTYRNRE